MCSSDSAWGDGDAVQQRANSVNDYLPFYLSKGYYLCCQAFIGMQHFCITIMKNELQWLKLNLFSCVEGDECLGVGDYCLPKQLGYCLCSSADSVTSQLAGNCFWDQ